MLRAAFDLTGPETPGWARPSHVQPRPRWRNRCRASDRGRGFADDRFQCAGTTLESEEFGKAHAKNGWPVMVDVKLTLTISGHNRIELWDVRWSGQ